MHTGQSRKIVDTCKYSQVNASDSQILASPNLGANTCKCLTSPWICEYTCTQCWNSRGNIEHTAWRVPMRASEQYIILQLLIMRVPFSLFSEPRIYSIILYICSILTSKSPRAFARVPVPTRVNEGDTFISTRKCMEIPSQISHTWAHGVSSPNWFISSEFLIRFLLIMIRQVVNIIYQCQFLLYDSLLS